MNVNAPTASSDRSPVTSPSANATGSASGHDILLVEDINPAAEEILTAAGLRVTRRSGALVPDALDGVQVVGIRSKSQIDADVLARFPDLLAVGCFCIGTNQVDLDDAGRRGIAVFNAPFSNTRSVAEMTIAEVIGLHRRLFDKSALLHQGQWDKSAANAHEIRGRTLGIIGYGHIGSQVSVLAEALGMRVVYYDVIAKLPLGNAQPMDSLDELLRASDVVTLHVPATPLTHEMIGAAELSRMRPGSYLINNARGTVVALEPLADAIRRGHLRGAALDVYPIEPRASRDAFECVLAGLDNVVLTPHIGGSTEEAQENIAREVAAKLVHYLSNGTTTSAVNVPEVQLPQLRHDQHRILHIHRNVPGVLSKMHRMLADAGVNINAEYLQSNPEVSYVILDVDPHHGEAVEAGLASIEETIRMRRVW